MGQAGEGGEVAHKRVLRVGEAIKREIGTILDRRVADPRLGMVTVTRVDLTDDLRHAKVCVSFLGGDEQKKEGMRTLIRIRGLIRSELSRRLRLRTAPQLRFVLDESSENYLKIAKIIKEIHDHDNEAGGGPEGHPDDSQE
jgi:ribosome-binding factor A